MSFSILTNKQIQSISLFSVRVVEAQRIFDLIQQNVSIPKSIITIQNIQNFTQNYYEKGFNKANRIITVLQKQGLQLNEQNFKIALAYAIKETELSTAGTLLEYYDAIQSFFHLKFSSNLEDIDRWNVAEPLTTVNIQKRKTAIKNFYDLTYPYINQMTYYAFEKYLVHINYCYTLDAISDNQEDVLTVFQTFTTPSVFDFLARFIHEFDDVVKRQLINNPINININLDTYFNYLKNIAHLYGACRYPMMREKIQKNSCLLYFETYSILISALRVTDIRIKEQIMVCFALLSKYSQNFIEWVLTDIQNCLIPLLQQITTTKDQSNVYCSLVCLKNIVKSFRKQSQIFCNNPTIGNILLKIHSFSYVVLKNSQFLLNQRQCIHMLNQILQICKFPQSQIQEIKLVSQIFSANQTFQNTLVPAALKVLETSILNRVQQLTQNIIKNQGFIKSLLINIVDKNSLLFYQFVHITYLLSFEYSQFLIQKGILTQIIKLMDQPNSVLISIGSDIIYHTVLQSLQNDKILEELYDKFALFQRIIPFLFNKCFENNEFLNLLFSRVLKNTEQAPKSYNYFNKYVFFNIFKIIYCLSAGVSRKHKKFSFTKRLSLELVTSIANVLRDLFGFENYPLMSLILREPIRYLKTKTIKLEEGISFFKMINNIIEQMTFNMQNKPIELLKLINSLKKSYCNNLTNYFPLKDLQAENIPIYITLEFNLEVDMEKTSFKREIPHKFELSVIKAYLRHKVAQLYQIKQAQIQNISLKNGSNRAIENQIGYRGIVKKALENKQPFFISLDIIQVKIKAKREDLSRSIVSGFGGKPGLSTIQTGYKDNRLNTSKVTRSRIIQNNAWSTTRQNANQRRNYYSPYNLEASNFRQREYSPNFGGGNIQSRNR